MKSIFFISLLLNINLLFGQANFVSGNTNSDIQSNSYITILGNVIWETNSQVSVKDYKYDACDCSWCEFNNSHLTFSNEELEK